MNRLKKLRNALEVFLLRAGFVLLAPLPRRWIVTLANGFGRLAYYLAPELRRTGWANLDLVYGDTLQPEAKRAILTRSFQTFALAIFDLFWFSRDTRNRLEQYVCAGNVPAELFTGQAHICVTAHMGSWELLTHFMALRGFPLVSVVAPVANPQVEAVLQEVREMLGQEVIPKRGAVRELLRTLRDQGKIGLVLDQNTKPTQGGLFVDFFGVPVCMSSVAASLALRTGATIIVGVMLPQRDGTHVVEVIGKEIVPHSSPSDIREATVDLTRTVAHRIERAWLWMYKRWKYLAPGVKRGRYPYYAKPAPLAKTGVVA